MVADNSLSPDICSGSLKVSSFINKIFGCKSVSRYHLIRVCCEGVKEESEKSSSDERASQVDARHQVDLRPRRLKVGRHTCCRLLPHVRLVEVEEVEAFVGIGRAEVGSTHFHCFLRECGFPLKEKVKLDKGDLNAQTWLHCEIVRWRPTSNPVDKTAVLMRLPSMELHWKKKKKTPKNFAITASTSPSSPKATNLNFSKVRDLRRRRRRRPASRLSEERALGRPKRSSSKTDHCSRWQQSVEL